MQQQAKTPGTAQTEQNFAAEETLSQPDYFYGELNAGEDSAEWQEFARLQQPTALRRN